MSFLIDDDGITRNVDGRDATQLLRDASSILVRHLASEQTRRLALEAAVAEFLATGDRQRFEAAIDPRDAHHEAPTAEVAVAVDDGGALPPAPPDAG